MTGIVLATASEGAGATPWFVGIFVLLIFFVLLAITLVIGGGRPHE
jgi:hypothetical protein